MIRRRHKRAPGLFGDPLARAAEFLRGGTSGGGRVSDGIAALHHQDAGPSSPLPASGDRRTAGSGAVKLLTATGGGLDVPEDVRLACALYGDGTFLVHRPQLHNSRVLEVQRAAHERLGVPLKPVEAVDLARLFEAYGEAASQRLPDATGARQRLLSLIERAAAVGASDIQISLHGDRAEVRFQLHGYLTDPVDELHAREVEALFTTAFYLANHGEPCEKPGEAQRSSVTNRKLLPANVLALRQQFAPLGDGRHLNIRLCYAVIPGVGQTLDSLDLPPHVLREMYAMQQRASGLVTICAPTEHGKSTTLHFWLCDLSDSRGNKITIVSCDDPPEGLDPRILHFPVLARTSDGRDPLDVAFETSLRVSPHVVRLGECRTPWQAHKAFEAANFGKLVGTSLHCDHVLEIPYRYVELGVPEATAFAAHRHGGWVGQRLMPCLCRTCARRLEEVARVDQRRAALLDDFRTVGIPTADLLVHGDGTVDGEPCPECRHPSLRVTTPGYVGRRLLAESLRPTGELMAVLRRDMEAARRLWIGNGGHSLRMASYELLAAGVIGADECAEFGGSALEIGADLEARRAGPPPRAIAGASLDRGIAA